MASSLKENPSNFQENPFLESNTHKSTSTNRKNARYYFAQYCSATSIHGIQYIGERSRYIIERLFWIAVMTTVTALCLTLIAKTYNKWVTSPVIVSFATTETSIAKIPFPSITICPEVKSNPDIFNYTNTYIKRIREEALTEMEELFDESFRLVCEDNDISTGNFGGYRDFIDDEGVMMLILGAQQLDPNNISEVSWIGIKKKPIDYLNFLFTREGVCYNFNMLNIDDILTDPEEYAVNASAKVQKIKGWSLDSGYPNIPINESYPRRTALTGVTGGFMFDNMYVNNTHLDYICGSSLQGFKVVLHHPGDWPNLDKHFRVPLDSAVYVGIKPRLTTISEELRDYLPKDRKCYLSHEKPLLYFKTYTQYNCMEECSANYTLKMCGCQAFYMPKLHDSPTCGAGKKKCIEESKLSYVKESSEECGCLPSCTSLEYDLELTQTDWKWQEAFTIFKKEGFTNDAFNDAHLSRLSIYFKEMQFLSSERHELYGIVDFFSNIGGLLGLFMGFSVTSLVEILYFCTLRLWCNFKRYGGRYWSGEPELLEEKEE